MLPLTFADPADYDKIAPTDRIAIKGLTTFAPGKPLTLEVRMPRGAPPPVGACAQRRPRRAMREPSIA
jgi:hypothetical protein